MSGDRLFGGGDTSVVAALGALVPRPSYRAHPFRTSDGSPLYAWADGAVGWTATVSSDGHERGSSGARFQALTSTSADNAALVYSDQSGPTTRDNGDGQRGRGARVTQIFQPSGNVKDLVVGARFSATAPDGTEATNTLGVSRLNGTDPSNFYAFARGSGATSRRLIGPYTSGHVYFSTWEVVGGRVEIRLFNFSTGEWIGGPIAFAATTVANASSQLFYSVTTTGTSAAEVDCGVTEVFPSFRAV